MPSKAFREMVEQHMVAAGLSLRQTAAEIGVTPGFLSRVLSGEREPSDAVVLQLARTLRIDPPELLLVEADAADYDRDLTEREIRALVKRFREKLILPRVQRRR